MYKQVKKLLITLLFSTLLIIPLHAHASESLSAAQRKLWSDHVLWTRNFIISDLASLEDKDAVLQRLLKNQDDIGNSIKPYYGEAAGDQLASLLRTHIVIAGQVLDAAQASNAEALAVSNDLWYKNADEIAAFLSAANPNWSKKELKDMLSEHLNLTTVEVVSRLNKDWAADIAAYDKGEDHMLLFADMLTDGITKQFPNKVPH